MDAIEKRARELLAERLDSVGNRNSAIELRKGGGSQHDRVALSAVIAALTPPEGYVLVPIKTLEEITRYAEVYVGTHDFVLMTNERKMLHVRKAQEILSSCPEVP